jgi:hypothetical protein
MFGSTWTRFGSVLTIFAIAVACLYFSAARPMTDAVLSIGLVILFFLGFAYVYVGPAAWVVRDAQQRGGIGPAVAVVVGCLGPLSALVWLLIRPKTRLIDRLPGEYADPDTALSDAARLDQLGEWDAAIAIYEQVIQNWPDHQAYATACLEQIRQKQALASPAQ